MCEKKKEEYKLSFDEWGPYALLLIGEVFILGMMLCPHIMKGGAG